MSLLHQDLTDKIISAYYNVYNGLGYGFLEKVYENAMLVELEEQGLSARKQKPIRVNYKGKNVGEYFADIIIEEKVIVELKVINEREKSFREEHEAQLLNYLKATNIEVGLLLNFGLKPIIRRKIYENDYK
ncbi:MAG: GxxExxY protein [Saprospiraceae bacterium]